VTGFFKRLSDDRYRRASNRRRTEEIMGWICVPIILVICWFGWKAWEQMLAERPQLREQIMPSTVGVQRK
jgi:hypothetical protein